MYFWERRKEIRDSDEKSAGCRILVKKERECGIKTPLPDPVLTVKPTMNIRLNIHSFTSRIFRLP